MQVEEKGGEYMRSKRKSKIPEFKSYEEEAHFWDTHSFTDFEDELEDVSIVFDLQKPKEETLVLRIQKKIKYSLENIAKSKGISISSLARMWIMEKLHSSRI